MEGKDLCYLRQMGKDEEFLNQGMEAAVKSVSTRLDILLENFFIIALIFFCGNISRIFGLIYS